MKEYGLIGYPLDHSFSASYFEEKFKGKPDLSFQLFPIRNIGLLPSLLSDHAHLRGLAVTIPYKESVKQFLDTLHPSAIEVGAVNCISIRDKLTGYNTDIKGFELSLKPLLKLHHKNALVFGTGGGSKAVQFVLKQLGIAFTLVSTSDPAALAYQEINEDILNQHTILINCTPLGMIPAINSKPLIPYQYISEQHLLYDLVYNPSVTAFLEEGRKRNATIKNGYEMLVLQAEENWGIWNEG